MPTYSVTATCKRDAANLPPGERAALMLAISHMVADLKAGHGFRKGLRVKRVRGMPGMFEMTWTHDGRAIFMYGPEVRPGDPHIIWMAVGTHGILP